MAIGLLISDAKITIPLNYSISFVTFYSAA